MSNGRHSKRFQARGAKSLFRLIVRKVISQITCKIFNLRIFTELPELYQSLTSSSMPICRLILCSSSNHLRCFFLSKQVDLQGKVTALVGFVCHPVLAYPNKSREENCFQR